MHSILQDLRYGLRQLRKSPGYALTAVLTLTLGIGATTALFSVVNGVLLKPLAYRESGRLVVIWERVRFLEKFSPYIGANPRHADVWRRQASSLSDLTLLQHNWTGVGLGGDHPRLVGRLKAQPNLLDVLGVQPFLGRNLLPDESVAGRDHVAVISWHLWQELFHGDTGAVGRTVQIAGEPFQVVGVLPRSFYFPKANELTPLPEAHQMPEIEVISPLIIDPNKFGWNSDYGNYIALGHLKSGVSVAQAQEQLNVLVEDIARQVPPDQMDGDPHGALGTYVQPMKEAIVGKTAVRLWLLMAAVVSVLLVACVNLANTQLARFMRRDREAAVRSALGASSMQLLQSALAEVCILAAVGGALGIGLAFVAVCWFSSYAEAAIPRTSAVTVSWGVLALTVVLTVGSAFLFGVLPALRSLRVKPQHVLQGSGRSTGSHGSDLLRRWLIGAQVFACTTLLLISGLFAKSLIRLSTFDKGFSSDHVVAADAVLQGKAFDDKAKASFEDGVLEKLRQLPGVQSATLVSAMLLEGESWIDGVVPVGKAQIQSPLANYRWIGPDYFATLRERIVEGRALDARDREGKNAVISEATAKAVWPNQEAVGRQFKRNGQTFTVVGIVADAHNNSLRAAPVNMVYLPYWDNAPGSAFFLVRGSQEPSQLVGAVRAAIWSYNPDVTIAFVHTLDSQVSDSLAPEHLQTMIFAAFGGAALLLALLGIYGTLSYSVEARTQEVGIRIALGASRQNVYGLMLGMVTVPILVGLALGWIASLSIGRSLAALLYGTSPTDMSVVLPVICAFVAAAMASTYLPCRRAAMIEPMKALRAE
jgi:predicted permease